MPRRVTPLSLLDMALNRGRRSLASFITTAAKALFGAEPSSSRQRRNESAVLAMLEQLEREANPPPRREQSTFTTDPLPTESAPGSFTTYRIKETAPPRPSEELPFGQEILTPASTNVYSFSYKRHPGQATGTLFVTFKAPALNSGSITTGRARVGRSQSRDQLMGTLGSTVVGKSNERGPMYAYLNVPPAVFSQLKAVKDNGNQHGPGVKSPGTGVWDLLRVRGTIYGHRYRYVLVQGAVLAGSGGVYIPRVATRAGFKTRSIKDIGGKTFQSSTLPASNGFRTRNLPSRRSRT